MSAPIHHFLQQNESLRDEREKHRAHPITQTVSTASEFFFFFLLKVIYTDGKLQNDIFEHSESAAHSSS